MDEVDVLRRLNALADVPSPDPQRALDGIRAALLADPKPSPSLGRMGKMTRYAAALVAIAAATLLAVWLADPFAVGSLAFADVQKKVEQTKTLTMTFSGAGPDGPQSGTAYALADGRMRLEDADGHFSVIDPKTERSLAVDPARKEALLIRGYFNRLPTDVYRLLRDVRKNEVKKLPAERLTGQVTEVFVAKVSLGEIDQEVKVWVEPKLQLPVRLELVHKDEAGAEQKMVIDLKFDQPLDERLFSTDAPAGFKLRTEGVEGPPVKRFEDANTLAPEVKPKVGIGPVTFGMMQDQVIEKLGKPDKIDQRGTALDYLSRGYSILVSPRRGVVRITCFTQAIFLVKVKDFAGKTTEGIGMGANAADIVKAYGEPDVKETEDLMTRLSYRKLGLEFALANDKLVDFALSRVP